MEPVRLTSAAVPRCPIKAYSAIEDAIAASINKVDDDFNIVIISMRCFPPTRKWYATCDQARKPFWLGPSENFASSLIVPTVCTDGTKHVFENAAGKMEHD